MPPQDNQDPNANVNPAADQPVAPAGAPMGNDPVAPAEPVAPSEPSSGSFGGNSFGQPDVGAVSTPAEPAAPMGDDSAPAEPAAPSEPAAPEVGGDQPSGPVVG